MDDIGKSNQTVWNRQSLPTFHLDTITRAHIETNVKRLITSNPQAFVRSLDNCASCTRYAE